MKKLSSVTISGGLTVDQATTLSGVVSVGGIGTGAYTSVLVRNSSNQMLYRTFSDFLNDISGSLNLSGYVPTSRTLTINGTTYDLSADRTWTITTPFVSKLQHTVKAGVAINKGQAVYVTGADGTNIIVGLASNASEATSSKTMGLLDATVSTNGFANVVTEGLLAGLDTSTAGAAGDPVWLGTGGNLIYGLGSKPYAPAHLVFIGIVTRKNANNGEIFVKVQNGFELKEIHDVDLITSAPTAGQLLRYESDGLWKNWSPNYLTAEADTLNSVTGRGASTANLITVGGATISNNLITTNGITDPGYARITNPEGGISINNSPIGAAIKIALPANGSFTNTMISFTVHIYDYALGKTRTLKIAGYTYYNQDWYNMSVYQSGGELIGNINVRFGVEGGRNCVWIGETNTYWSYPNIFVTDVQCGHSQTANLTSGWTISLVTTLGTVQNTIVAYTNITTKDIGGTTNYVSKFTGANTLGNSLIFDNGTNVGIGTASPGYKLDIQGIVSVGTTAVGGTLRLEGKGGFSYPAQISTTTVSGIKFSDDSLGMNVVFLSSGNVGIGTTSPTQLLHVVGTNAANNGLTLQNTNASGNSQVRFLNTSGTERAAITYVNGSDAVYHYTAAGGNLLNLVGANVGIGTASPTGKLDIVPSAQNAINISRAGGYASLYSSNDFVFETDSIFYFGVYTPRLFSVNGSFYTTAAGSVGIGTSSPSYKLHVNGTAYINETLYVNQATTIEDTFTVKTQNGSYNVAVIDYSGTAGGRIKVYTDGILRSQIGSYYGDDTFFNVGYGGNVGIGTSSPSTKLNIYSDTTADGILVDVLSRPRITLRDRGNSDTIIGTGDYGLDDFFIDTYSGNALAIKGSTRNVGIGTTSPNEKLHVAGNINAYVNGGIDAGLFASTSAGSTTIALRSNGITHFNGGSVGIGTFSPTDSLSVQGNTNLGNSYGSTTSSTYTTRVSGYAMRYDASNRYGNYGVLILNADSGWTSSARRFMLTSGLNVNKFAIIRSVDSTTDPSFGDGGAISSGTADFVIDSAGNVGIGTTSPGSKLEVNGTLGVNGNATFNGGNVYINSDNSYIGNNTTDLVSLSGSTMYFPGNGRVGINTTTPTAPLEIINTGSAGGGLTMFGSAYYGGLKYWGMRIYGIDNGQGIHYSTDVQVGADWYSATKVGHGQNATNPSFQSYYTTYLATTGGNVGIGTTSPGWKLHVAGESYTSGVVRIGGTSPLYFEDYGGGWYMADSSWVRTYNAKSVWVGGGLLGGDGGLTIGYGGTSYGTNNAIISGLVGIGTSVPTTKLDVRGNFLLKGDATDGGILTITRRYSTGAQTINFNNNHPGTNLDWTGARITSADAGNYNGYLDFAVSLGSNGSEAAGTAAVASVMRLTKDGYVGIGTTSPSAKLHVVGKSIFENNMRIYPASESWAEGLSFIMPTTANWGGLRWQRQRGNNDGNWYVGFTALDSTDDLVFGANNGGSQVDNILRLTKAGNVSIGGNTTINGIWQTNISTAGGWSKLSFTASNAWGDGTTYGTLGASGGNEPGVMVYNMHATWAGSGQGAGIRMGRSGGVIGGDWYQVATMDANEFMIAKNGQWSNGGIKITSGGELQHGNSGNKYWHAGNDGSGSGLDADLLDGQNSTEFLRLLSGGAEASLDSYTDNGIRVVNFTGHSQHLLSWNAGGSTGTVQQLFHYGTPNNGWRIRNKTDNSSWSDWGYVVMASSNQGLISGTIATQSWVGSQSYATTSYVTTQINNLIAGAPGALDTLDELAAALGDDSNFATTVTNSIAGKVSKSGDTMTSSGQQVLNIFHGAATGDFNDALFVKNTVSEQQVQIGMATTGSDGDHHRVSLRAYKGAQALEGVFGIALRQPGSAAHTQRLTLDYLGNLTIGGALTESSSLKLKENVETSEGNLEKVVNLRPVTFNKIGSQTTELGLIAEEVAEVYPEFVQYDENGEPIGVNYSRLTAALIGAVKQLTQRIETLEKNG